jgi:hypothetical protein
MGSNMLAALRNHNNCGDPMDELTPDYLMACLLAPIGAFLIAALLL